MIRQLGTPTWFFTLSAADLKWPDMIQTIARQYGVYYTDDEVAALSFDEKSNWLKRNPVTAARHFHYRLNVLFQDFLKSTAKPLGEIVDYAIRIEFQARGSPYAHCVIIYGSKMIQSLVLITVMMCVTLLTSKSHVKSRQKMANWNTLYSSFKSTNIPHIAGGIKPVVSVFLSLPVPKPSLQKMILRVATITRSWLC